ncbi:nipped-B-like protein isoform X2 [Nilaparvata lugens]|uniref:nipped-B-like protein isoform X2 n=1 Tax=Nilaparvata lugens TaxID=108931 RepID=UPI00193DCA37|nr:nipped-B-like protein isoform X2 [Nilaparvata lugens]
MGKRRRSRKSSVSSQLIDVSEIAKQVPTNKTNVEKRDTDSTEIQTYNVVTTNIEEINNESFVLDCENSVNVVPAALIEVNNNTTELVDKNSAEVSNDCILTGHQKKGKENTESSQEKRDLFKNLLKFLKKSIEKATNFVDDQAFVDVFKKKQLHNLCREAAKLHKTSSLRPLPFDKMDFTVAILNKIISHGNGIVVSNSQDNCYDLSSKSDPVFKGVYACLLQLYIWTSPGIDKKLINDEGIENVTLFLKLCLDNVVFPAYNMNSGSNGGSMKKNVGNKKANEVDKITLQLYNDLTEAVQLLELLLRDQTLTDTHILRINSFSIPAFFVKNIGSIQLALLKLVECVFSKYKKLRKVMLDDLISCMEKAAGDLKQYESYKLESGGKIQMLTALLMKMVQSVVHFPLSLLEQNEVDVKVVAEEKIGEARNAAIHFMQSLLRMCCENSNEGFRGAVVSLVQDLLSAVDRPEWPVSEIMLHMFLFVLFENHHASHQKRLLSLEFLTAVYSALQEKSKKHQENEHKIDQLFENMQREDEPDEKCRKIELEDSKKVELLQNALLDFILRREDVEPALLHARHLHLAHWYIERTKTLLNNSEKPVEKPVDKRKTGKSPAKSSTSGNKSTLSQNNSNMKMLLNKFHDKPVINMNSHHVEDEDTRLFIDVGMAQLITHSFLSKRSLHLNFNSYLTLLLSGLKDTSTPVRLKAMRCLSHLIVVAPDVLSMKNVEAAVKAAVYDQSIAIRESAIDIISKIVLKKSNMDDCHITLLSERILDTGVSVRKKVIKTLGDLCLKFPASQKTPEIAAKIMKRISDEPGVHNMVLEFFYKLWFLPIDSDAEPELANRRISSIVNVMNLCMAAGLDSFETLLTSLMNPNDDVCDRRGMKNISADEIFEVSQKIVDGLVRKMLDESATPFFSPQMASVFLFAKLKPKLVVRHIDSLHKLLHFTHQTANTQLIIYNLRTIELAIPLLKHANQNMMRGLESNFEKIIISQERTVIQSCISCMKMFTEKLSQNFEFVAHLMKKYYDFLINYSTHIEKLLADNEDDTLASVAKNQFRKKTCKRAFFVVGLLMRYFNFCDKQVCCNILPMTITDDIVCVLDKFCRVEDGELKLYAVMAMGNVCVRYCKLMFKDGLKGLYCNFLSNAEVATELKVQENCQSVIDEDLSIYKYWYEIIAGNLHVVQSVLVVELASHNVLICWFRLLKTNHSSISLHLASFNISTYMFIFELLRVGL